MQRAQVISESLAGAADAGWLGGGGRELEYGTEIRDGKYRGIG